MEEINVGDLHFRVSDQPAFFDPILAKYREDRGYGIVGASKGTYCVPNGYVADIEEKDGRRQWQAIWQNPVRWPVKESDTEPQQNQCYESNGRTIRLKGPVILLPRRSKQICLYIDSENYNLKSALCPKCHQRLPKKAGFEEPITLALAGLTRNAKTAFIWGLINYCLRNGSFNTQFMLGERRIDFTISFDGHDCENSTRGASVRNSGINRLAQTQTAEFPLPLVLHVEVKVRDSTGEKCKKYMLLIRDIAGEIGAAVADDIMNEKKIGKLIYEIIGRVDTIFFVVDSGNLSHIGGEINEVHAISERFSLYTAYMHRQQSLAIIMSKSDIISDWANNIGEDSVERQSLDTPSVRRYLYECSDICMETDGQHEGFTNYFNNMSETTKLVIKTCTNGGMSIYDLLSGQIPTGVTKGWFMMSALGCDREDPQVGILPPRHLFDPIIWSVVKKMQRDGIFERRNL